MELMIVEGIIALPVVAVGLWIGCGVISDNITRWLSRRAAAQRHNDLSSRTERLEHELGMATGA